MPAAFGAYRDVGIHAESDSLRVAGGVEHDFNVVEVREDKLASAFQRQEGELRPEFEKPLLRVSVDFPVAFHLAELDGGAHKLRTNSRAAEFAADSQTFDFCEIRKISDAQASDRFIAHIAEKMSGGKI